LEADTGIDVLQRQLRNLPPANSFRSGSLHDIFVTIEPGDVNPAQHDLSISGPGILIAADGNDNRVG
jgi:hypothetical protein